MKQLTLSSSQLLISVVLLVVSAQAASSSDESKEQQLYHNYKKFNQLPTQSEKWNQALSNAKSETYEVQKGDNLWEISETLFGDPEFWPKIWALNKDGIFNPHEIEPKDNIRFLAGTMGEAPQFSAVAAGQVETISARGAADKNEKEPVVAKPIIVDVDLKNVKIPAPEKQAHAAVNPPKSLPVWKQQKEKVVKTEFDLKRISPRPGVQSFDVISFVAESKVLSVGEITQSEGGMPFTHEQKVVVLKASGLEEGSHLLVLREVGELKNGENIGYIQMIDAELTVLGAVLGHPELTRARVSRAFSTVLVGSKVIAGTVERIPISESVAESAVEVPAKIIGGPHSETRELFSPGEFLFLNRGSNSGLTVGQVLKVFRGASSVEDDQALDRGHAIGFIQVMKAGATFSTGLVLSANEEVRVGDSTSSSPQ